MEGFIELILGNPLLLLLIAGSLISLFRNKEGEKKNQETEQRQQPDGQSQPKKPSPFGDFLDRMEETLTDREEEKPVRSKPSYNKEPVQETMSAHDKRMEQMQQISNQIESGTYRGAGDESHSGFADGSHSGLTNDKSSSAQVNKETNLQTKKLRKQMKQRLNKKSIIDSVIMSEVLGEPRSKRPYQARNMNKHNLY